MEQSKACNQCKQIKPITEFYIIKKNPIRYKAICKPCSLSNSKEYLKTYIPPENSVLGKKLKEKNWDRSSRLCEVCKNSYIPRTKWQITCSYECGYYRQNRRVPKSINTGFCLRCGKSLEHKNNRAIYCSRTCLSMDHNFKHRGRGGRRVTTARRRLIIERDNFTCYLCKKLVPFKEVEIDHLLPRSRGGDSSPKNLSVSCLKCNRSRGNRIGVEQLVRLQELRESNDY